jgi:UDP-2,4-diacetamido-2,4,6-trideoxy-beta-L-altropyranose hydrolase
MRVAFRADASRWIGHGHVMRCLALADALHDSGAVCRFFCLAEEGNLLGEIRARGHEVVSVDAMQADDGAEWVTTGIENWRPHWLVVDHYALDARWESRMAASTDHIVVIDDLVNRDHACALLVDQTFGRDAMAYRSRVPGHCRVLAGAEYALLRPAFALLRQESLALRRTPSLHHILVSVGGVDADDAAGRVLHALASVVLPSDLTISVALTSAAPHLLALRARAARMPHRTKIVVDAPDMPRLLMSADLAIGAGGTSSWERCCLGIPTIVLALVENQRGVAKALHDAGAALWIEDMAALDTRLSAALRDLASPAALSAMSLFASQVTDGRGAARVIAAMEAIDD